MLIVVLAPTAMSMARRAGVGRGVREDRQPPLRGAGELTEQNVHRALSAVHFDMLEPAIGSFIEPDSSTVIMMFGETLLAAT